MINDCAYTCYTTLTLVDDSISSDYKSTVFKTNNNVFGKLLTTYYHYLDPYLVIIIVIRVINITNCSIFRVPDIEKY